MNIDEDKVTQIVTQQLINNLEPVVQDTLIALVKQRFNEKLAQTVDKLVEEQARKLFQQGLETAFQSVDSFGQRNGKSTTISKELEKFTSTYWATRVDRNGKPTDSNYQQATRAEYLMAQICAEDFSKQMKNAAVTVTGSLKDSLRNQLAKHTDGLLDSLFKVKSLQDQGKVEKPY